MPPRFKETHHLGLLAFFCFSLSVLRVLYTGSTVFLCLNWNLFLAFIPWGLSRLVLAKAEIRNSKIALSILLLVWLLFFPNAPYILTDLFHFRHASGAPIWFDLVMFLSFAWTGLLFGFLSLRDVEQLFQKRMSRRWVNLVIAGLLFLGSYGIYLGRYLRWNSWDIVREPFGLFLEIGDHLIHPIQHPRAWGMTILMGILLNLFYWSFRLVRRWEPGGPAT